MSSGGGGGGNTTTVQKADPWSGVQPYLTGAYQNLSQLYAPGAPGPQYYPGSTLAPFNPLENVGQNMQLGQTGQMQNVANLANGSLGTMSGLGTEGANQGLGLTNQGSDLMKYIQQHTAGGADASMAALNGLLSTSNTAGGGINGADTAMKILQGYGASGITNTGTSGTVDAMHQLNQAGDFNNNPAFQQALQSAIRPVTENFQENVLPSIGSAAIGAGQMGSSRQGIAEGIASRGYLNSIGDISANMGNQAYAQGLQALNSSGQLGQGLAAMGLGATQNAGNLGYNLGGLQGNMLGQAGSLGSGLAGLSGQLGTGIAGLGNNLYGSGLQSLGQQAALAPGVQQALTYPGMLTQQLGQQQTANNQAEINADMARWNYGQNLPYSMMSDYLQLLQGAPGGQTSSQQTGGGSNRLMGALGGAGTGAAIGSAFAPGIGTAIGAGAGALLSLF